MSRGLFVLLILSVWINYMDRGNLGVAAPQLKSELALTPSQLGLLLSAFFWTYSLLQPLAGWLVDRYDVFRLYGGAFALWSVAVLAAGFANDFTVLFLSRLALGAGESIAYPAYSRILANNFDESRRGFANAMIDVGTKGGPALGTFLGGLAVAEVGWRGFFFWMGGLSLIWLLPWLRSIPAVTTQASVTAATPLAWMRTRAAFATFLGLFCFNYAFYFLLTWLPTYLVQQRKFSLREMAVFGALPYCATAIASFAAGAYADSRVRAGAEPGPLRRRVAVLGLSLAALTLFGATQENNAISLALLILAFTGIGLFTANVWAITQTLAGPRRAGSWTGWQNACGNMGGVAAPIVTGWCVESAGGFNLAFAVATALLFAAALFYGFALPRVQEVSID